MEPLASHQNSTRHMGTTLKGLAQRLQLCQKRVHRVQSENTGGRIGYCLDLVDLFLSKAVAGREKDREFCTALITHGYTTVDMALSLVATMPLDVSEQRALRATIRRSAKAAQMQ